MRSTDLIVNSRIHVPSVEFDFTFIRSSGPGGQNVNKVSSKAVLRWNPRASQGLPEDVRARFLAKFASRLTTDSDLILASQRYRDQGRNISDCIEKLREMLQQVAIAPVKRRPTKPSKGAKRRRLDSKKADSQKKQSRRFRGDE